MSDDIKLLYELQLLYNKEAELKKVSKESFINFSETKEKFESIKSQRDKLAKDLSDCKKSLQDEELNLHTLEEHIKKHEKELFSNKSTNPKFLTELENKVKELKNKKDKSEETVLTLMEEVEELKKMLNSFDEILKSAEIDLKDKENIFNNEQNETKKILEEINLRRKILRENINPEYLEAFDRTYLMGQGKSVSRILGNVCGVCKSTIPLSIIQKLKKEPNMLMYCENCGRILYLSE